MEYGRVSKTAHFDVNFKSLAYSSIVVVSIVVVGVEKKRKEEKTKTKKRQYPALKLQK